MKTYVAVGLLMLLVGCHGGGYGTASANRDAKQQVRAMDPRGWIDGWTNAQGQPVSDREAWRCEVEAAQVTLNGAGNIPLFGALSPIVAQDLRQRCLASYGFKPPVE